MTDDGNARHKQPFASRSRMEMQKAMQLSDSIVPGQEAMGGGQHVLCTFSYSTPTASRELSSGDFDGQQIALRVHEHVPFAALHFVLGWQAYLEEDILQSREIGREA